MDLSLYSKNWGGRRVCAGRKKSCACKVAFNRRINKDVLVLLKSYAVRHGITETEALEKAIVLQSNIEKGEKQMETENLTKKTCRRHHKKNDCSCKEDCKCGCQEGKPCHCHDHACHCKEDCTCGCQKGNHCSCNE